MGGEGGHQVACIGGRQHNDCQLDKYSDTAYCRVFEVMRISCFKLDKREITIIETKGKVLE